MSLFNREEKPKRDISEILTPKTNDEGESEEKVEEKEQEIEYFESKEDFGTNALSCFGWKEDKTDKWLIKCAHIWYGAMSFFWFLFGAITFAPIIFISKKVKVIFKNKTNSLICAIVIWFLIIGSIVLLFSTRKSDKQPKEEIDYGVSQQTETVIVEQTESAIAE